MRRTYIRTISGRPRPAYRPGFELVTWRSRVFACCAMTTRCHQVNDDCVHPIIRRYLYSTGWWLAVCLLYLCATEDRLDDVIYTSLQHRPQTDANMHRAALDSMSPYSDGRPPSGIDNWWLWTPLETGSGRIVAFISAKGHNECSTIWYGWFKLWK